MARLTRLSTEGVDGVNAGIGSIFKALAAAPMVRQQAQDDSALRAAQTYAQTMAGNKYGAEAEAGQFTLERRRQVPDVAPEGMPAYEHLAQKLFRDTGDTNMERYAQAVLHAQKAGNIDGVQAGTVDPLRTSQAYFAVSGHAPFGNAKADGYSTNLLTGEQIEANPTVAKIYQDGRAAETDAEKAKAYRDRAAGAKSYSGIRVDNAQIGEIQQRTEMGGKGQIVQTDSGIMLVDPRRPNSARPVTTPDGQPLTKPLKDLPPQVATALRENGSALRKIDTALAAAEEYPDAFGAWNYVGDTVRQRTDPKGVEARALVADIGSLKIHDRSGAAVTAAEFPRLAPFIPQATDKPETVKKKLALFRKEYEDIQRDIQASYSRENGYRAPGAAPAPSPKPGKTVVRTGRAPDGRKVVQYSDNTIEYAD